MIESLVGAMLAICVGLLATHSRLDRDGAFYPTVSIFVAALYLSTRLLTGPNLALK